LIHWVGLTLRLSGRYALYLQTFFRAFLTTSRKANTSQRASLATPSRSVHFNPLNLPRPIASAENCVHHNVTSRRRGLTNVAADKHFSDAVIGTAGEPSEPDHLLEWMSAREAAGLLVPASHRWAVSEWSATPDRGV
jgi:hypothetical protein